MPFYFICFFFVGRFNAHRLQPSLDDVSMAAPEGPSTDVPSEVSHAFFLFGGGVEYNSHCVQPVLDDMSMTPQEPSTNVPNDVSSQVSYANILLCICFS